MRSLQQRRDRVRFRNSTERLSTNNLNLNANINENLRTGSREVLSQSAQISPAQTPASPQAPLLGESVGQLGGQPGGQPGDQLGGQPALEESREPVASRLEGLSLGQEGRHRIKVDLILQMYQKLSASPVYYLFLRFWSPETRRIRHVFQSTTFPPADQASSSSWNNSPNDRGRFCPPPSPPCPGRLPSTRGSGSCRRSWTT